MNFSLNMHFKKFIALLKLAFLFLSGNLLLTSFSFCEESWPSMEDQTCKNEGKENKFSKENLNELVKVVTIGCGLILSILLAYLFFSSNGSSPSPSPSSSSSSLSNQVVLPSTIHLLKTAVFDPEFFKYGFTVLSTASLYQILRTNPEIRLGDYFIERFARNPVILNGDAFFINKVIPSSALSNFPKCENLADLSVLIQNYENLKPDSIALIVLSIFLKLPTLVRTLGYANLLSAYVIESYKQISHYKSLHNLSKVDINDVLSILNHLNFEQRDAFFLYVHKVGVERLPRQYSEIPREHISEIGNFGSFNGYDGFLRMLSFDLMNYFSHLSENDVEFSVIDMEKLFFYITAGILHGNFLAWRVKKEKERVAYWSAVEASLAASADE